MDKKRIEKIMKIKNTRTKRKHKQPTAELIGKISRLYTTSQKFSAGLIIDKDGYKRSFKGFFQIEADRSVKLFGDWTDDPKWGRQFSAQGYEYIIPIDIDGLAIYIENHPKIKGVGSAKSKVISKKCAERLNNNDLSEFNNSDISLLKSCGLSQKDAINFITVWKDEISFNHISQILASNGLSYSQIHKVVDMYGSGAEAVLKANPYQMIEDIKGIGFRIADDIAFKFGMKKRNPDRIKAGALYILEQNEKQGSTIMLWKEFLIEANKLLIMDTPDAITIIKDVVKSNTPDLFSFARIDGDIIISLASTHDTVVSLYEMIEENMYSKSIVSDDAIKTILDTYPKVVDEKEITPTNGQIKAVYNSFRNRFSVYTGGAGTGKTFIAKIITEIALYNGLSVALAAPTGKAAQRMETVIGQKAKTIHRLLEFDPREGGFQRNENNPLSENIIIVDETSMLDIYLAKKLFDAIDFDTSSLIFIGDHNQLPSVGAGNVLADLINAGTVPVTLLDKVMRQAGTLKKNCMSILSGDFIDKITPNEWEIVAGIKTQEEIISYIRSMICGGFKEKGFDFFDDVQILSPQKIGSLGTKALNKIIQKIVQEYFNDVIIPKEDEIKKELYIGDRVIQMRNNYNTGVMNGTLGRVTYIDRYNKMYHIMFENCSELIMVKRGTEAWTDIELAYVLTVHKSQGSEFPCSMIIMNKSHQFMHNRNWLYTAVTRSQRTVMLIGDKLPIRRAVKKVVNNKRRTWLCHLLKQLDTKTREIETDE